MEKIKLQIKNLWLEHKAGKTVVLSRSRFGTFILFLFLALFCCFMILPMFYSVVQSLKPIEEIYAFPPRFFVKNPTFSNFTQIFHLSDNLWVPFSRYLFNSVFVTIIGTTLNILIATMAAYALSKSKIRFKNAYTTLIIIAMMFQGEVTAIPQYLVISKLKLTDTYGAMILPALAGTMGLYLMKQFIVSSVPDATLEAARIDGAGEFRILFNIVMPSVKPAMMTLLIFTFQAFWNGTGAQYIFSEELKQLPSVLSAISAGGIARTGAASAVSVLMMIPPILIFVYSQSSVMETMAHSGLK